MADFEQMPFDGIICIGGEDWWYHNRGHFDFQVMQRLAKTLPVLFVNSIAVRMPSLVEPGQFAARVSRKLKSLSRGLVLVEDNFWVMSPFAVPGGTGQRLSGWMLAPQINRAAAEIGIRRPLLWVHCPAGARLVDDISHAALVMQRTDRFEAFPEADPAVVGRQIAELKSRADLAVYCNADLMASEATEVRRQILLSHGVDLDHFARAGDGRGEDPVEFTALKRPRAGFIGGIDAHTFAPELFLAVAAQLPDVTFVLVGDCSLAKDWCTLGNVVHTSRKPYDQIARYMAAMDVLIMPWNDSPWIRACNPIKLKEYLAVGRPVVTTDFPALRPYRANVRVAETAGAFAQAIRDALHSPSNSASVRRQLAGETWDAKAESILLAMIDVAVSKSGRRATAA